MKLTTEQKQEILDQQGQKHETKRVTSTDILSNLDSLGAIFIEDLEFMKTSEDWERAVFNLIND